MQRFIRLFLVLLTIVFVSKSVRASDGIAHEAILTFGVVPQQAASKTARLWAPIFDYISVKTGYKIRLKTASKIPIFEERVAAGEYDFAYMNPYHYVVFSKVPGYRAFAKQKDKEIIGLLVAKKDGAVKSISDLNGHTLAFPSPAAFAASILPRAFLRQQGVSFTPKYVSSHDSVYQNVAKGFFPVGGGISRTLNSTNRETRENLTIVWKSPGYTPHAFAAHPRISAEIVERIANVMLGMGHDLTGRELLAKVKFKGIVGVKASDWEDVRALGISLLDAVSDKAGQ
jgi:phosphonate transport system substrate-binding protein